jgi:hypothetical protein
MPPEFYDENVEGGADEYSPLEMYYVPKYVDPQIVIARLQRIIVKQDLEIKRLRKENSDMVTENIKHSEAMMGNLLTVLLDRDKFTGKKKG